MPRRKIQARVTKALQNAAVKGWKLRSSSPRDPLDQSSIGGGLAVSLANPSLAENTLSTDLHNTDTKAVDSEKKHVVKPLPSTSLPEVQKKSPQEEFLSKIYSLFCTNDGHIEFFTKTDVNLCKFNAMRTCKTAIELDGKFTMQKLDDVIIHEVVARNNWESNILKYIESNYKHNAYYLSDKIKGCRFAFERSIIDAEYVFPEERRQSLMENARSVFVFNNKDLAQEIISDICNQSLRFFGEKVEKLDVDSIII